MHCKRIIPQITASVVTPALFISALLLLSACSSTPILLKTFDFGLPTPNASSQIDLENKKEQKISTHQLQFKLADIQVSNNLESDAMLYRLLYNNTQQLLPYTESRWSMPPAQLLSQRIKSHINQLGGMVVSANEGAYDLPLLRLELEEFSQHFTSPQQSYASIQFRASLIYRNKNFSSDNNKDHINIISQKHFAATSNSTSPDAVGGAQAMPLATDMALSQLSAWIQTQIQ